MAGEPAKTVPVLFRFDHDQPIGTLTLVKSLEESLIDGSTYILSAGIQIHPGGEKVLKVVGIIPEPAIPSTERR